MAGARRPSAKRRAPRAAARQPTRHTMDACRRAVSALHECKRSIGLQPRQCYPRTGYKGTCDELEFGLKKCLAMQADSRDAAVLYNASAPREARIAANKRLQKKLQKYNFDCIP